MTRRQRLKELVTPFSGIDQSNQSTLIPDGLSPRAQNTIYDYGEISKKEGTIAIGATTGDMPFAEEVQGFANYTSAAGVTTLIALTDSMIYSYSSGADSWTSVNAGVGADLVDSTATNKYVCFLADATGANGPEAASYATYWLKTPYLNDTHEPYGASHVAGTWNGSDVSTPSFTHAQHSPSIPNTLNAGRYLVINNGIDNIQIFDGTSVSPLRTWGGVSAYTYRKAKQTIFFNSVLIQIVPTESGTTQEHQVLWSGIGDILDWDATSSASTSGLYNLFDTSGKLIRGEIIGDNALALYKEDAIFTLTPSGSTNVFNIQLNVNGTGLLAYDAIAVLEDRHIFIATDGFFIFSGGSVVEPAGRNVWKEFIEDFDFDAKEAVRSVVDRENTRVKFYFPSATEGSGKNTRVVVYDYGENWWTLEELNGKVTATGNYTTATSRTWQSPAAKGDGTWGAQTETWGEMRSTSGSVKAIFGSPAGYTTEQSEVTYDELVDGTENIIDQVHETKDFTSADIIGQDYQDRYILFQGLIIDGKGSCVDVDYSTNGGVSWTTIKSMQALTGTYERYKLDFRVTSRMIRFRFRNNILNSFFSLRNRLGIRYIPRNR